MRDVSPIGHRGTGDAVTHPSLSEAAQVIDRDQTSNTVTASELVPVSQQIYKEDRSLKVEKEIVMKDGDTVVIENG